MGRLVPNVTRGEGVGDRVMFSLPTGPRRSTRAKSPASGMASRQGTELRSVPIFEAPPPRGSPAATVISVLAAGHITEARPREHRARVDQSPGHDNGRRRYTVTADRPDHSRPHLPHSALAGVAAAAPAGAPRPRGFDPLIMHLGDFPHRHPPVHRRLLDPPEGLQLVTRAWSAAHPWPGPPACASPTGRPRSATSPSSVAAACAGDRDLDGPHQLLLVNGFTMYSITPASQPPAPPAPAARRR